MSGDVGIKRECQRLVMESGLRMLNSGLTVSTWGNVSYCDRQEGLMYITPSGMDYATLTDDDINVYTLEGDLIFGHRRPSIEIEMHRKVLNAREDASACIHTHPIFSTVFSSMGDGIPIDIHDEAAQTFGDSIRCADYCLPGTGELADAAVAAMGQTANACLLRSHGAVCIGPDMDAAFKVATVLEMVAEIYWRIRATGGTYVPISMENVSAMQDFVQTRYGQY